ESTSIANVLLTDVITQISHKVAGEEVRAEKERVREEKRRKAEEARKKQERETFLELISHSQCRDLIKEVLKESIYNISNDELQHAVQLDHDARIACCSEAVCDHYLDQFLEEEILKLATESQREMWYYNKYLQRWKEVVAVRKKMRRQMRGFPAAPGSVARDDKLKALIPSAALLSNSWELSKGSINMGHVGKLLVSFTRFQQIREQLFHQMKVQHFLQNLLCDAAWTPLELTPLIAQNVKSWNNCIFWKVVLLLPEKSENGVTQTILSEWLKAKFSCMEGQALDAQQQCVETLSLYSSLELQSTHPVRVNVCVKVVQGPLTLSEMDQAEAKKDLLGTRGLVLLLPPVAEDTEEDVYWLSALLQVKQLLQAKPFQPPIPLAVLVPGLTMNLLSEVDEGLMLKDLVSSGLISKYEIFHLSDSLNDLQATQQVSSAVQFLLSKCPCTLELCSIPLRQFIEDGVCREFSEPFHQDVWERRKAGLPSQDPSAIIDLYNNVITFLADVVSSEQLFDISWPVTEFTNPNGSTVLPHLGWNSPRHLAWLKKLVLSFQIPQMDKPPQGAPWLPVCSMVMEYIDHISRSRHGLPVLFSEVEILLKRAYKRWHKKGGEGEEAFLVEEFPWQDLLSLCINHKLRDWDPSVSSEYTGSPEDVMVYFLQEDIKKFRRSDVWERARMSTHTDVQEASDNTSCIQQSLLQRPKTMASIHVSSKENIENDILSTELEHTNKLTLRLKESLKAEKEQTEGCKEKLQKLLEDEALEPSVSFSLPMYLPEALLNPPEVQSHLPIGNSHTPSLQMSIETAFSAIDLYSSSKQRTKTLYPLPRSSENTLHSSYVQWSLMDRTPAQSLNLSLTDKMQELRRLINTSHQEDAALELHLNTILDVGKPLNAAEHYL
ncbi:hypothetical protein GDO86_000636, partial [Hymenochirus boettgeri]